MNGSNDLIPVRALNQVTYCSRLYYLEYVEAVMPINEHVEDGLFQHRRVDNPDLQHRTRKEGDALHTRSIQLSSERLGIAGKLDLVEEHPPRSATAAVTSPAWKRRFEWPSASPMRACPFTCLQCTTTREH